MSLKTYSNSGATTEESSFEVGATIYINGDITTSAATTSTAVKLEVFNSSDVLQATPLDTTHNFTNNTNQDIKDDINSGTAPSWDSTGATAGEFYVKTTVSGTAVETTNDYEWFEVTGAFPAITNILLSNTSISTTEESSLTCDISNMTSADRAYVTIETGGAYQYSKALTTGDNAGYLLALKGIEIGEISAGTVKVWAVNSVGFDQEDAGDTLTVTAATGLDPLETIRALLESAWTAANANDLTPQFLKSYGAPKQIEVRDEDANSMDGILVYYVRGTETPGDLSYAAINVETILRIDIRSMGAGQSDKYAHGRLLLTEVKRILHALRKNISSTGYHHLDIGTETDLTQRSSQFIRYTFDIKLEVFGRTI